MCRAIGAPRGQAPEPGWDHAVVASGAQTGGFAGGEITLVVVAVVPVVGSLVFGCPGCLGLVGGNTYSKCSAVQCPWVSLAVATKGSSSSASGGSAVQGGGREGCNYYKAVSYTHLTLPTRFAV